MPYTSIQLRSNKDLNDVREIAMDRLEWRFLCTEIEKAAWRTALSQTVRSQCFPPVRLQRPALAPASPISPTFCSYCPIHQPLSYLRQTYLANRLGPPPLPPAYEMNWPPPAGAHLLEPFGHQVAGQSSMLRYDETTVCKPLITREHFVYQTLPESLKEFTAEYRGELEVGLAEKDGYLQLYGLCVKDDSNEDLCQCSMPDNEQRDEKARINAAKLGSHYPEPLSAPINIPNADSSDVDDQNGCVIKVLRSSSYEMCSPTSDNALSHPNYKPNAQIPKPGNLNPWSLENHKRLLDKMRKGKHKHNSFRGILLKNAVADFKYPCILDLKIGSRLHGDEAPPDKVENQTKKCAESTSNTLGVRLCGMQVYQKHTGQYINLDKYQGRLLTDETFRNTLLRFLHNGVRYRSELLQPIVDKLSRLINSLYTVNTYRFYASSLLIIYDGLGGETDPKFTNQVKTDSKCNSTVLDYSTERCDMYPGQFNSQSSSTGGIRSEDVGNSNSRDQKPKLNGLIQETPTINKTSNPSHSSSSSSSSLPCSSLVNKQSTSNKSTSSCESNQSVCDSNHAATKYNNTDSQINQSHIGSDSDAVTYNNQTFKNSDSQMFPSTTETISNHSTANDHTLPASSSLSSHKQDVNVEVKMIDFAHTTHKGFPNDPCQHEGPDMNYIHGLTNLGALFENLMAEC